VSERRVSLPIRARAPASDPRPSLGVYFKCAHRYVRVFRSPTANRYIARCPKCGKSIRFRVGPGGTSQRFFEVSC